MGGVYIIMHSLAATALNQQCCLFTKHKAYNFRLGVGVVVVVVGSWGEVAILPSSFWSLFRPRSHFLPLRSSISGSGVSINIPGLGLSWHCKSLVLHLFCLLTCLLGKKKRTRIRDIR